MFAFPRIAFCLRLMLRLITCLAIALILTSISVLSEDTYNKAYFDSILDGPKKEKSKEQLEEERLVSRASDANFDLAMFYIDRENPEKQAKAARLLRELAEGGHAKAQYMVSKMYFRGDFGYPQDNKESLRWLKKSAENNFDEAQLLLGSMYSSGQLTETNHEEAFKWIKKAADNGLLNAEFLVAQLLQMGRGVPKDENAAAERLEDLVNEGYEPAYSSLCNVYLKSKNNEAAFDVMKKGADKGFRESTLLLASFYYTGTGTPKNLELCYKYLIIAENKNWDGAEASRLNVEKDLKPQELKNFRAKYPLKSKK